MNYLEKSYSDHYEISLSPFGDEVSELDQSVFDRVEADKPLLYKRTVDYIGELVDYSRPPF